jgi:hypothetical protein
MRTYAHLLAVVSLAASSPAIAGGMSKHVCHESDGAKKKVFVPRSCSDQFSTYSRDLSMGIDGSASAAGGSGSAVLQSQVVQLQMDELNKELRAHYVASCQAASMDPCGGGMAAFVRMNERLPEVYSSLRIALARQEDPSQAAELVEEARAALAQATSQQAEQLAALLAVLESGGVSARDATGISGQWAVAVTPDAAATTCGSQIIESAHRVWTVEESDGQVSVIVDGAVPGSDASKVIPRLDGRLDGDRLTLTGRMPGDATHDPSVADYQLRRMPGDQLLGTLTISGPGYSCVMAGRVEGRR